MRCNCLPLLLIILELLSRRYRGAGGRSSAGPVDGDSPPLGYAALVALVTWQALRGQSIVHPDALTLLVFAAIALAVGDSVSGGAGAKGP